MSNSPHFLQSMAALFRQQRRARQIGSRPWAKRLAHYGSPNFPAQASSSDRLTLPELGLDLSPAHQFALGAYGYLWDIKACGFTLSPVESGEIEVAGQGVRSRLNSVEEAFIFSEIFCERIYDVQPAPKATVIDIGMNIGLASLFFASSLPDCKVEAFEPFASTYARARYQLSLNSSLAGRINPNNYGLWTTNERRQIEIAADHKGSTGIWGVQSDLEASKQDKPSVQEIELRNAAEVLGPMLDAQRGGPVILKLDAEGSEYGIFDQLAKAGLADRFNVILMEWHRNQSGHDPVQLRAQLSRLGYRSLCQQYLHRQFGMIYAFR